MSWGACAVLELLLLDPASSTSDYLAQWKSGGQPHPQPTVVQSGVRLDKWSGPLVPGEAINPVTPTLNNR